MAWWGWVLLVLSGWSFWNLFRILTAKPAPSVSAVSHYVPCTYCAEESAGFLALDEKGYNKYHRDFDKIDTMVFEKPKVALERIERLLSVAPNADHDSLANSIVDCFEMLSEGKSPQEILNLFDTVCKKGHVLQFAARHGHKKRLSETLVVSLMNSIPDVITMRYLEDSFQFVEQEHDLVGMLRKEGINGLYRYLDDIAFQVESDIEWVRNHASYEAAKQKLVELVQRAAAG